MPAEITKKINAALVKALAEPEVKAAIEKGGYESVSSTPEQLGAMVRRDIDRWGRIIKDIGYKPQ
jgi:tripartite-type tricarboxylate transporter receptor subunit TctC